MKNNKPFFLLIFLLLTHISCRTTKDIEMFQDLGLKTSKDSFLNKPPEHRIKPFDNLYINILTLDPDVNKIFNPSLAGDGYSTGTQQMYGTPTSQYINGFRVAVDGTIDLPIIGVIKFDGLTLEEAEKRLKEKAEEYLQEPTVQVKLLNFRISVLGEVNNPGFFYNYEGSINIIDAISLANGITEHANLSNVIVNRKDNYLTRTYKIDLTNSDIYKSEVFFLQPNDMVYIPPNKLKRMRENNTTYSLVLSTVSTILVLLTLLIK